MRDMIELNDTELMMVAGGQVVGPLNLNVQTNVNAAAQAALGVAVLSPGAVVTATNLAKQFQLNASL
jgi:hypothetical protein